MTALPALFSCNGNFGSGTTAAPEYAQARDLVDQMDRLGVARALVWHQECRSLNVTSGNRRLLRELAGLEERLVPAAGLGPAVMWQAGEIEELRADLIAGRFRALRLFPASIRHSLGRIERALSALADLKTPVFVSIRELGGPTDMADLDRLAGLFPETTFVCTEFMWGHMGSVVDLMAQRPNVAAENSWMHVDNAIEQLVAWFGAERLLFGLGPKCHHGAAIAQLACADLTGAQREAIAHGSLERLLGVGPATVTVPAPDPAKPRWNALREGEVPAGSEILDVHTHIGPPSHGWVISHTGVKDQVERLVRRMDTCGIELSLVADLRPLFGDGLEGNRLALESIAPFPDRLKAYIGFNPHNCERLIPALPEMLANPAVAGFKLLCDYWRVPATDPVFEPVWENAHKYRLPILMHTWDGAYDSPAMFTDIAPKYPDATFLLGHSGGGDGGRREAVALAAKCPNVLLEFCGSFTAMTPFEDTIRRVGTDRVVFGSDTAVHDVAWELGRCLSMPLSDAQLAPMLGGTMRQVLARRRLP